MYFERASNSSVTTRFCDAFAKSKCPLLRRVIEPIIIITNRAHSHYFVMARTGDSRANKATAPSNRAEATRSRSKRTGKQSNPNHPSKTLCLLCRNEDPGPSSSTEMRSRSSTRVMANPPSTDPFVRSVSQMSFRFHASFTKYVLYFCFRRRRSFVCRPLEPTPLGHSGELNRDPHRARYFSHR